MHAPCTINGPFAGDFVSRKDDVRTDRGAVIKQLVHVIGDLLCYVPLSYDVLVRMCDGVTTKEQFAQIGAVIQVRSLSTICKLKEFTIRKWFAPKRFVIPAKSRTRAIGIAAVSIGVHVERCVDHSFYYQFA